MQTASRLLLILLLLSYAGISAYSQNTSRKTILQASKPLIDTSSVFNWFGIDEDVHVAISNNGNWFTYRAKNLPRGANTLFVESADKTWSRSFVNAEKVCFSDDNKQFVFKRNDSLFLLKTGSKDQPVIIPAMRTYKTASSKGSHILAYQTRSSDSLWLLDLVSNQKRSYGEVNLFQFNSQGTVMILQSNTGGSSNLRWIDLQRNTGVSIYKGSPVLSGQFDHSGSKLAFVVSHSEKDISIWQYNSGTNTALQRVTKTSPGMRIGLLLQSSVKFSHDDRYLFLTVQKDIPKLTPKPNAVQVNIWSYKDPIIQSSQLKNPIPERTYTCVTTTDIDATATIIQLEEENERIHIPEYSDYALVTWSNQDSIGDRFWLQKKSKRWLIPLNDGKRFELPLKDDSKIDQIYFAPDGEHLLIWDSMDATYGSFNLKTKKYTIITSDKKFATIFPYQKPASFYTNVGPLGWTSRGSAVLVNDNFDIWKLDLTGKQKPENLTKGLGALSSIKFRCINQAYMDVIPNGKKLILSGFNIRNKQNGFYRLSIDGIGKLDSLIMSQYTYYHAPRVADGHEFQTNMVPVKARDADAWIVKRHSSTESPNYFLTHDLKKYTALTDLAPEKEVNWLRSELVEFPQSNGVVNQGVLYKPENFDPSKKYPLIINYYNQFSHRVFEFPQPAITNNGNINIPWYVSNGYLVFTPDIYFFDLPGVSALQAVESAADYLTRLSYVDSKRLGIAGHSFGGGLTNYIVTHSKRFAAALCGAPGNADIISRALQLVEEGNQLGAYEETFGQTIWENPKRWLDASPVMSADKVTTPYLIFHCRPDGVPFQQSVEMFISLRRLERRVWMLEYDNGHHALYDKKDALDFNKRVNQFFDHYLKDALPPVWMTKGIPASLKGIESGFELDQSGKQP